MALTLALLQGCASMSKKECLYADWYQIGLEDGSVGRNAVMLAQHRKACAKAGVTPDLAAYERGHVEGLQRYCNYNNGLNVGSRGSAMPDYCPPNRVEDFTFGYRHGQERFQQRQVITAISNDITNLQNALAEYYDDKALLEDLLVSEEATKHERIQALIDIRRIDEQVVQVEVDLLTLESQLVAEQQILQDIIDHQQRY